MESAIYINGRFLGQPVTGVQRYAYELLNQFDLILDASSKYQKIKIHCLVPPDIKTRQLWKNINIQAVGMNNGNTWEQLDLPLYLRGKLLFSPANTGPFLYKTQVLTIHDASVFAVPHAYSLQFRLKHKLINYTLSQLAKAIITDSEFSQKELSRFLKQSLTRYHVIRLSGNHIKNIKPSPGTLKKYGLVKNEYVLIVASQSRHKNLKTAILALQYVKSEVKFVFIGGSFQKIFNNNAAPAESKNVLNLGYISDQELKALYENALGFLFPSQYEGFGLPILEAMHCGCPVICANVTSLPEVAGTAALFFNPEHPAEIAQAIDRINLDRNLRDELIGLGYRRASEFNWHHTAENTLRVILTAFNLEV